jgi:hypothetical protein
MNWNKGLVRNNTIAISRSAERTLGENKVKREVIVQAWLNHAHTMLKAYLATCKVTVDMQIVQCELSNIIIAHVQCINSEASEPVAYNVYITLKREIYACFTPADWVVMEMAER